MAFDKKVNPRLTMRQRANRATPKRKRGGRGHAPYFVNSYKPPTKGYDLIRLLPGEYAIPLVDQENECMLVDEEGNQMYEVLEYFPYVRYYHGAKKRSAIGSEGPLGQFKGQGDDCPAAEWYWWEWRERKANGTNKPNAMSKQDMNAFSVLVMGTFYKVPDTDRDGNIRVNPKTREPYYTWEKASKRGNSKYDAKGYEKKQGHVMHWSVGWGHHNYLLESNRSLGEHCVNCGGRDCIQDLAWVCRNCGEAVIEMDTTTLDEEDIDKMTSEECTCPHCQHTGYLEDVYECSNCNSAKRASLFDFDLKVQRVEASDGGNQTALSIIEAIGPKPIDKVYGEEMRKGLELDKIFAPTEVERQIELFGRPPKEDEEGDEPKRTPSSKGATRPYAQ